MALQEHFGTTDLRGKKYVLTWTYHPRPLNTAVANSALTIATRMRADNPRLFWRSRADNPVNEFYFEQADGCVKGEKWHVFWYGLESFEQIQYAVEHCRDRPATLKSA